MALVSGNRTNAGLCGAGTVNLNNVLSNANTNIGAALSNLAVISYMGWLKHAQVYTVYRKHVRPYLSIAWLKELIRRYHREELRKNEYCAIRKRIQTA